MYTAEDLEKILIDEFVDNPKAFGPGHRNDDAVDLCCICRSLDIDPRKTFYDIMSKQDYVNSGPAEEAFCRVMKYADNWGKPGTTEPMRYAINY